MQEKCLFMDAERHFSISNSFSSKEGVLGENAVKETPQKSIGKRNIGSVQSVGINNHEYLELAFPSKKIAKTKRSATPSKIMTRTVQKSSDGRHLQKCSERSTEKPPSTVDAVKKKIKQAIKAPKPHQKAKTKNRSNTTFRPSWSS